MSKSILISLIGKETIPNYRAYKEFMPDVVVHVFSDQTMEAECILSKMIAPFTKVHSLKVDANNYKSIIDTLQSQLNISSTDNLMLNITGGTKMMALAVNSYAIETQEKANVKPFYIDLNQNIHWYEEDRIDVFSQKITLEEFISLSGQYILSKDAYRDVYPKYKPAIKAIKSRLFDGSLNAFLKQVTKEVRNVMSRNRSFKSELGVVLNLQKNNTITDFNFEWDSEELTITFKENSFLKLKLSEPEINSFLFNAGWFELLVAEKYAKKYNPADIYLNVKFPYLANLLQEKNEVDILINDGEKLLFIECKSGMVKSSDLHSIEVRKQTYGGLIGSSVLVTRYPLDSPGSLQGKNSVEKCKELGISYTTLKSLKV